MILQTRVAALLAAAAGMLGVGCVGDLCEYAPEVCGSAVGGGGGAGTGGEGAGVSAGGTGGEGGAPIPPGCDPTEGEALADNCGIYVQAGASGDGSYGNPYGTMTDAADNLGAATRIYVCGGDMFTGSFALPGGVSVFGSLSCGDWTYRTKNETPLLRGDQNVPAVTISGGGQTMLMALRITAVDAEDFNTTTLQGNSSIALMVSGTTMTLEDVSLVAGVGAAGGPGEDHVGQAEGRQVLALQDDFDGNNGSACDGTPGPAKTYVCAGDPTTGSAGGPGGTGSMGGTSSFSGAPDYLIGEPNGTQGAGDIGPGVWDCSVNNGDGQNGHPGPVANVAAGGVDVGSISDQGYVGDPGSPGGDGEPGQGGGGGGGRRRGSCGTSGATGGSGGAGGCGGLGGGGGGAGGASIGIVSLGAMWTFAGVNVAVAAGGTGGEGGDSQTGGTGGNGGDGIAGGGYTGCSGGNGGTGAAGGSGAGGRGGPSVGVAYVGTDPALSAAAVTFAPAASGGPGGNANADANNGALGDSGVSLAFP